MRVVLDTNVLVRASIPGTGPARALFEPHIVPADPDDDSVLHTALIGRADILCTLNRHLYHPTVTDYCTRHSIRIASDVELLNLLRSRDKGTPW